MKKKHIQLIFTILWTLFIFTQSLLPGNGSSEQSGFIVDVLYPLVSKIGITIQVNDFSFLIRKFAHFTEYFILGLLLCILYIEIIKPNKLWLIVIIHGAITALIDETIQLFTPNRSGEVRDVLIDITGVIIGMILTKLVIKLIKKHKSK